MWGESGRVSVRSQDRDHVCTQELIGLDTQMSGLDRTRNEVAYRRADDDGLSSAFQPSGGALASSTSTAGARFSASLPRVDEVAGADSGTTSVMRGGNRNAEQGSTRGLELGFLDDRELVVDPGIANPTRNRRKRNRKPWKSCCYCTWQSLCVTLGTFALIFTLLIVYVEYYEENGISMDARGGTSGRPGSSDSSSGHLMLKRGARADAAGPDLLLDAGAAAELNGATVVTRRNFRPSDGSLVALPTRYAHNKRGRGGARNDNAMLLGGAPDNEGSNTTPDDDEADATDQNDLRPAATMHPVLDGSVTLLDEDQERRAAPNALDTHRIKRFAVTSTTRELMKILNRRTEQRSETTQVETEKDNVSKPVAAHPTVPEALTEILEKHGRHLVVDVYDYVPGCTVSASSAAEGTAGSVVKKRPLSGHANVKVTYRASKHAPRNEPIGILALYPTGNFMEHYGTPATGGKARADSPSSAQERSRPNDDVSSASTSSPSQSSSPQPLAAAELAPRPSWWSWGSDGDENPPQVAMSLTHTILALSLLELLARERPALASDVVVTFSPDVTRRGVGVDRLLEEGVFMRDPSMADAYHSDKLMPLASSSAGTPAAARSGALVYLQGGGGQPVCGSMGTFFWKLEVTGQNAPAGKPQEAINALELTHTALDKIQASFYNEFSRFSGLDRRYGFEASSTMKPTQITCDGTGETIPGKCTAIGDIRLSPFVRVEEARRKIESVITKLNENVGKLTGRGPHSRFELYRHEMNGGAVAVEANRLGRLEFFWLHPRREAELNEGFVCQHRTPGHFALVQAAREGRMAALGKSTSVEDERSTTATSNLADAMGASSFSSGASTTATDSSTGGGLFSGTASTRYRRGGRSEPQATAAVGGQAALAGKVYPHSIGGSLRFAKLLQAFGNDVQVIGFEGHQTLSALNADFRVLVRHVALLEMFYRTGVLLQL
ncbi:unnamed protein product [Amoebophrya sp. A25]|nr:unnamed protein product [Amoebophrya sp. A25]|eukprot:GSA25T00016668001.1